MWGSSVRAFLRWPQILLFVVVLGSGPFLILGAYGGSDPLQPGVNAYRLHPPLWRILEWS